MMFPKFLLSPLFAECNKCFKDNSICDEETRVCTCKPEWTGDKCQGKPKPILTTNTLELC